MDYVRTLVDTTTDLQNRVRELEGRVARYQSEREEQDGIVAALEARCERRDAQLQRDAAALRNLEGQVHALNEAWRSQRAQILGLQETRDRLRAERNEYRERCVKYEGEIETLERELALSGQKNTGLANEIQKLQAQLNVRRPSMGPSAYPLGNRKSSRSSDSGSSRTYVADALGSLDGGSQRRDRSRGSSCSSRSGDEQRDNREYSSFRWQSSTRYTIRKAQEGKDRQAR